jgi:hypothetical protein
MRSRKRLHLAHLSLRSLHLLNFRYGSKAVTGSAPGTGHSGQPPETEPFDVRYGLKSAGLPQRLPRRGNSKLVMTGL